MASPPLAYAAMMLVSRQHAIRIDATGLTIRDLITRRLAWSDLEKITVIARENGSRSLVGWLRPGVVPIAGGYGSPGLRLPSGAHDIYAIDVLDADTEEVTATVARFAGPAWQAAEDAGSAEGAGSAPT